MLVSQTIDKVNFVGYIKSHMPFYVPFMRCLDLLLLNITWVQMNKRGGTQKHVMSVLWAHKTLTPLRTTVLTLRKTLRNLKI